MTATSLTYLNDDPLWAERTLYRMLDEAISIELWQRERREHISVAPCALGHSPEVTRLLPLAERAGIVWDVRPDGRLTVTRG